VLVGILQGFGSVLHGLEDGRVGVCAFQGLSLHLDGREGAIDLLQLLLVALLSLQRLDGGCNGKFAKLVSQVRRYDAKVSHYR